MEEHDPIVESLRSLGEQPVDPVTASRHLSRMAGVRARTSFSTKVKIGAALGIGLFVGGSGLATAGALPGPAQDVAHTVLSSVSVNVPGGPQRYNGPECGGTYKNHGQYVRTHTQDPNGGQSRCGKPIQAGTGSDSTDAPDTPDKSSGAPQGNVAGGPQRYNGPECGGTYKNHGQYVRAHTQDPNAGQSRCGKPIQAGTGGVGDDGQPANSDGAGSTSQAPVVPSSTTTTTGPTPSTTSTTTTTSTPTTTSTTTSTTLG